MYNSQFNFESRTTPQGTLQSQGLYYQPPIPNKGTPRGTGVADGRAYTRNLQRGETTQGRLEDLLANESQYIQNARRRAAEGANARGMLNSSIAQGASQRAAIEAGMPIAQSDANAAFQAGSQNLDAMNENLMQERDIANRALQQRESLANSLANAQLQAATQRYGIDIGLLGDREQRAYSGEQAGLDRAHQYGMSTLEQMQQMERMGYGAQIDDWLQSQGLTRDMVRMGYGNELEQGNMRLGDVIARGQMGYGNQLEQSNMRLGQQFNLENLSVEQRNQLERMGYGNVLDQSNMNLADLIQRGQMQLGQDFNLQNLSVEQRNLLEQMGYGNVLEQSNMNLGYQQDLGRMGYGNTLERLLMGDQFGYDIGRMDRGYEQDLGRMDRGYQQDIGRMGAQFGYGQREQDAALRRDMLSMFASGQYGMTLQMLGDAWQNPDIFTPQALQGFSGLMNQIFSAEGWNWMDDIFGGGG